MNIIANLPTVIVTDALTLESLNVHVYCPQYPESTLLRKSSDNLKAASARSFWADRLADVAVVDQITGVATLLAESRHVMAPFSLTDNLPVSG